MFQSARLNRRSFVARITGGCVVGGAMAVVAGTHALAADGDEHAVTVNAPPLTIGPRARDHDITDNTPFPNTGPRRPPHTDNDGAFGRAGDPPGQGQGRGSATERIRHRPSGITDRDINDVAGNGRGTQMTGITDRDANDARGHGRGARGSQSR
jgi:hypothetical protein